MSGWLLAGFLVDAFDDALPDGVVDGNFVVAPAHGVAVFADVANDFVEDGIYAAVSGDD